MVLHSTERQGGGSGSSIALLQERFRQLQKMREKRQEMELLKLFPEPETMNQTNRYETLVRPTVHPDMMKTRPRFEDSTSLGLNLHTKQAEPKKPAKTRQFMDFWQVDSKKHEVDTSLHL
ncbi:hypothetical protein SSX86_003839 [Deinandra increscens subsp. villosa]|uniref:Uncharacterized protein n=1 Tax=Deinandra increscens subsp. villosa TaxID=3103831 RepID=A0AAP0DLV3_9ASTR